ncbi:MAG: nitroreductase [Oxalobacter sp.]|nr:MAG: nitroreductase [Oxalobacter sp.]
MANNVSKIVDDVIQSRRSIRAFRPDPVSQDAIQQILEVASRAVSAGNMQPWRVYVLTGASLKRVVDAVCQAFDTEPEKHTSEYEYLPKKNFEPYLSRRRKIGLAMYSLLGIERGDAERMRLQHRRNFEFFGASVGLIFTMDRKLPAACFMDQGAFWQNIMIAAKARGLDTCMQTIWSDYCRIVTRELNLGEDEMMLGGMAMGYADQDAPINTLLPERVPVSEFATFVQK